MLLNNTLKFLMALCLLVNGAWAAKGTFVVTDFGAKGDGKSLNTKAIQKALDAAGKVGGGIVEVPAGTYVSGTLFIRSHTKLVLHPNATILGSPRIEDYATLQAYHTDRQAYHLIVAQGVENISIEGGTIDGNGPAFWKDYDPNKPVQWIMAKEKKVSPMMEIEQCKDVRIADVQLKTGGGWTLHLNGSERVNVRDVRIVNNLFSPNSDGIDITGSADVSISDCFIKTCDDAICLKTTPESGVCKRVVVNNCVIETNCAALKLGAGESYKDIRQVTFSNCAIYNTSRPIGLYSLAGGSFEDITISNIVCDTRAPLVLNRPIHISLSRKSPEVQLGAIRNVMISNFVCNTQGRILMTADDGAMLENITLRDITLTYPYIEDPRPYVEGNKSNQFSKNSPFAKPALGAVVADNVKNLVIDGLNINWPTSNTVPKEWQIPVKLENGGAREFKSAYDKVKEVEMSAVWGRNLMGGYIDAPLATPSEKAVKRFDLTNSSIRVRE